MKVLKGIGNAAKGLVDFVLDNKLTSGGWYVVAVLAVSFALPALPILGTAVLTGGEYLLASGMGLLIGTGFGVLIEVGEYGFFAQRETELRFWKDWGKNKNKELDKGEVLQVSEEFRAEFEPIKVEEKTATTKKNTKVKTQEKQL